MVERLLEIFLGLEEDIAGQGRPDEFDKACRMPVANRNSACESADCANARYGGLNGDATGSAMEPTNPVDPEMLAHDPRRRVEPGEYPTNQNI